VCDGEPRAWQVTYDLLELFLVGPEMPGITTMWVTMLLEWVNHVAKFRWQTALDRTLSKGKVEITDA
jgi:hypothetical protein